jgi:hypothetical protein
MAKTPKRALRVPLFVKFLIGNLLLAALLITGGYLVVQGQTRLKSRGNYLDKHLKRFTNYLDGVSRALESAGKIVADNDEIVNPLVIAAQSANATPEAHQKGVEQAPDPKAGTDMGGPAFIYKLITEKGGMQPDLMVVVTADGRLLWSSPDSNIEYDDVGQMDALTIVRGGGTYSNKVLIHDGHAWEIVGVPIRTNAGQLIGGLVLGVRIERYMQQFKEQSDENEVFQHRMILVVDGHVVASVFDPKTWTELDKALKQESWVTQRRILGRKSGQKWGTFPRCARRSRLRPRRGHRFRTIAARAFRRWNR